MPVYKCVLIYRNDNTNLTWQVGNVIQASGLVSALSAMNTWNTKYLLCCHTAVNLDGGMVSDVTIYRDMTIYPPTAFTDTAGALTGGGLPDATAALFSAQGTATNQGSSHWWLHGLATSLMLTEDQLNTAAAAVLALNTACINYFQQYRKVATPVHALPVVNPPVSFGSGQLRGTVYVRRTGRPFVRNGQTHRYR